MTLDLASAGRLRMKFGPQSAAQSSGVSVALGGAALQRCIQCFMLNDGFSR